MGCVCVCVALHHQQNSNQGNMVTKATNYYKVLSTPLPLGPQCMYYCSCVSMYVCVCSNIVYSCLPVYA